MEQDEGRGTGQGVPAGRWWWDAEAGRPTLDAVQCLVGVQSYRIDRIPHRKKAKRAVQR